MTNKKNKFLLFCCSLMPGAGEMYLGFMKRGVSIMSAFFLVFIVSLSFNFSVLMFLIPVIWFYSFFSSNNLNSLPDDEFYAVEDYYLFHLDMANENKILLVKKYYKLIAIALIFFGISILWNNLFSFLRYFLFGYLAVPPFITDLIYQISSRFPQCIVAVGILLTGFYMIKGKKKQLDDLQR